MPRRPLKVSRRDVADLWFERQGFAAPRGAAPFTRSRFVDWLETVGALQLDSVNVLDRAHYLTLWSRFGPYDRAALDRWVYEDRVAFEYWGHEASILPRAHLPVALRRMRRFPPAAWARSAWWSRMATSTTSKRRVLRRIRGEGPLESVDFERHTDERPRAGVWSPQAPKEDKRSLGLLWHAGHLGVHSRRHFRRVYDLAERVYPESPVASTTEYEDSWLLRGLRGNGVAGAAHLDGYITAPKLSAERKRRVFARNLRRKRIVELEVEGLPGAHYALAEDVDRLGRAPRPEGTTLLCPFDSLLWQRRRAHELLGFRYRIEIYVPKPKREFGYYAMPILHDGELVGRIDPKLDRERARLEILKIGLEPGVDLDGPLRRGLRESFESLARFSSADDLRLPRGWAGRLG